jgi:hypothetical protein
LRLLRVIAGLNPRGSQSPRYSRLNNRPIGQDDNEVHLACRSFYRLVRKGDQSERDRRRAKLLSLADLDVVKGRHEVRCDLGHFLFRHRLREILLVSLEDVLQCPTIPGLHPDTGTASTANADVAMRMAARINNERTRSGTDNPSALSIALFSSWTA